MSAPVAPQGSEVSSPKNRSERGARWASAAPRLSTTGRLAPDPPLGRRSLRKCRRQGQVCTWFVPLVGTGPSGTGGRYVLGLCTSVRPVAAGIRNAANRTSMVLKRDSVELPARFFCTPARAAMTADDFRRADDRVRRRLGRPRRVPRRARGASCKPTRKLSAAQRDPEGTILVSSGVKPNPKRPCFDRARLGRTRQGMPAAKRGVVAAGLGPSTRPPGETGGRVRDHGHGAGSGQRVAGRTDRPPLACSLVGPTPGERCGRGGCLLSASPPRKIVAKPRAGRPRARIGRAIWKRVGRGSQNGLARATPTPQSTGGTA